MKLKLILTTAIVGVALALPSVSSAAPPPPTPTQDSVVLTGAPVTVVDPNNDSFTILELTATSGPSGENPSGLVRYDYFGAVRYFGPVTCLAVNGNTATINFLFTHLFLTSIATVQVVDDQPDTFTAMSTGRAPTDCSPLARPGGPLPSGDITVVDAQPLPTTRQQCLNDGWKQFGFKNQGQCIVFVNHG